MKIVLKNKKLVKEKIRIGRVEKVIKDIIRVEEKKLGEIEIILSDDQELLKINRKFLKHNYFTDVITFGYNKKNKINGDIFISIDTIRNNADKFGQDFLSELMRVIIHGVLHLAGYDDKSNAEKEFMRSKEDFYLNRYNKMGDE